MKRNSLLVSIFLLFVIIGWKMFFYDRNEYILGIPKMYLKDPRWVKSTIYYPFRHKKNITASGFQFKSKISDTCRIIAISRDLIKKYPFHTKVLLVGTGEDDGIYKVEDLMNARFKNRIDILVNGTHKLIMYDSVKIYEISPDYFRLKD